MTVPAIPSEVSYLSTGSTIYWSYAFTILDTIAGTDMEVWLTSPAGLTNKLTSNYTVDSLNSRVIYPTPVSLLPNLPAGWTITLKRAEPLSQELDLVNGGPFDGPAITGAFDKLTLIAQELRRDVDAGIAAVKGDPGDRFSTTALTEISLNNRLVLNGTTDYLTIPDHADFDFSGGVWEIEVDVNLTNHLTEHDVFMIGSGVDYMIVYVNNGGELYFALRSTAHGFEVALHTPLTTGVKHTIKVAENGNDYYLFLDGVLKSSTSTAYRPQNYSSVFAIGAQTGGGAPFLGYLGKMRVSNGICRNTTDYTPQVTPYVLDPYTKLLLTFEGTSGSTTITDSSASGHTVTAQGSAHIDIGPDISTTVEEGLAYIIGHTILVTQDVTHYGTGTVTSYDKATGVMTFSWLAKTGYGAYTGMALSLNGNSASKGATGATGAAGADGADGAPGTPAWKGNWSVATAYAVGDAVYDATSGSSYVCTSAHTGHQPPDASYWDLLAQKGDIGPTPYIYGKLLKIDVVTSTSVWTRPAGCTQVVVEVLGGGGGGGGKNTGGYFGAGGGAGGYVRKLFTSGISGTETVTVGLGGTAGAGSTGGTGGTSSFKTASAAGGEGGTVGNTGVKAGGAGGAGTGGDLNIAGATGDSVNVSDTSNLRGAKGAASMYGGGGNQQVAASNGKAATGYGAGGGGGYENYGGAGSPGVVIIYSYS